MKFSSNPFFIVDKQKQMFYNIKGECVIAIEGSKKEKENELLELTLEEHYSFYENQGLNKNEIIKKISKDRKINKNEVYQHFLHKNKNIK